MVKKPFDGSLYEDFLSAAYLETYDMNRTSTDLVF